MSVYCFLLAQSSLLVFLLGLTRFQDLYETAIKYCFYYLLAHALVMNLAMGMLLEDFLYKVAVRSYLLGAVFSCGVFLAIVGPPSWTIFGWYMCVLSFFHYSEFLTIAICNPKTLSIDSFILDHSLDYKIAAAASWVEFFIEHWLYEDLKMARVIPTAGLALCVAGELLRKTAMVTASTNFTHTVVSKKADTHSLVTHGVYRFCRHPSYVGWFYWSIGTQMILANPLCTVAYALASWKFFNDRITVEELTLLNFFDYDYVDYQKRVPTGLPFIKGYRITD